jgi:hypothetical protein
MPHYSIKTMRYFYNKLLLVNVCQKAAIADPFVFKTWNIFQIILKIKEARLFYAHFQTKQLGTKLKTIS